MRQQTISPVDGRVVDERELATVQACQAILSAGKRAQVEWSAESLDRRAEYCSGLVDAVLAQRDGIARELSLQMGRPVSQTPSELRGFEERARFMIAEAKTALDDVVPAEKPGFQRFVKREPLGLVLTVAPWNYPWLTAVNSIVPALMAGNVVVLKHSSQTPLVAERFRQACAAAGFPEGVLQVVHCSHDTTSQMIASEHVDYVAFTGSVAGGRAVQAAAAKRFIGQGLELGGKDPAYVRPDADLGFTVENLVDGAFFNSGQSCCAVERIYVARPVYDEFVERFVELTKQYRLGSPLSDDVNLGPMVRTSAADAVRRQVEQAISRGAVAHIDRALFPADTGRGPYLAPQVLTQVDHQMEVMTEESFGPVIGIMQVDGDDQAVNLMNDSRYGLTASVWTRDEQLALALGARVATGTWFMNRCDYLDPALAWTGVKDSGRGCTLSRVGYESLTRPKSFHLRL